MGHSVKERLYIAVHREVGRSIKNRHSENNSHRPVTEKPGQISRGERFSRRKLGKYKEQIHHGSSGNQGNEQEGHTPSQNQSNDPS